MSKTLALIAIGGFVLSIVFFAFAFLIAGDQVFRDERPLAAITPLVDTATRKEWRWNGGDTLSVEAPMRLRYRQEGLPNVTVTGPADLLAQVKVGGGQIASDRPMRGGKKLEATVSGTPIRKFMISGNQDLDLGHIEQENLDVRISGNGSVSADGKVDQLNLVMAGNGDARLGGLIARTAKVAILGHGNAILAPQESLTVTIAGRGVVRLKSHPASIQKTILGSGEIIEDGPGEPPAAHPPGDNAGSPAGSRGNFLITGSGDQELGRLQQEEVKVTITGSGNATAEGRVDRLSVMLTASGDAKLGALSAGQVNVTVSGSGNATIAPRDEAHITILGSGDVYLATRPRRIERTILGSGRIIEAN